MMRLLKDPSGGVRVNVVAALARHGVREASDDLIRTLGDERWYVRHATAMILL
ncbi:MAG: HEAT repeat domain-containing protein [Armatimonadetes bacterium]|nr:HEAT repeat domain-containing protein [Armatimonadota bacterium]